jgi:hypothetical protein
MMDSDLSRRLARAVQVMTFDEATMLREAVLGLEGLPRATWDDPLRNPSNRAATLFDRRQPAPTAADRIGVRSPW